MRPHRYGRKGFYTTVVVRGGGRPMAKRWRGGKGPKRASRRPPPPPRNPIAENARSILTVLAIVLVVAVVAYAIYASDLGDGDGNGGNGQPPAQAAPTFTLQEVDGGALELEQLRGRIVVLDLFATWCGPCVSQMSELNKLRAYYSTSDLVIISIDVDPDETSQMVRDFRDEHNCNWAFARDTDGVAGKYDASSIPTLALIDRDGNLAWRHAGLTYFGDLSARIDPLL
jgi:peroxiredoxin